MNGDLPSPLPSAYGSMSCEHKNDKEKGPNPFQRVMNHIQGRTLAGLFELLPMLVTAFVMYFIIAKADEFIRPLVHDLPRCTIGPWTFRASGSSTVIVVFYLIGLLVSIASQAVMAG